eukprot:SAG31_NODE_16275_length_715_cov_3.472403_2_plen_47_part_00
MQELYDTYMRDAMNQMLDDLMQKHLEGLITVEEFRDRTHTAKDSES